MSPELTKKSYHINETFLAIKTDITPLTMKKIEKKFFLFRNVYEFFSIEMKKNNFSNFALYFKLCPKTYSSGLFQIKVCDRKLCDQLKQRNIHKTA